MKTFREHLDKKLADRQFAEGFEREYEKLRIAYDIHEARVSQGFTQIELAKRAGVTQQMVSRVENAASSNMAHRTLSQIASALGKDIGLVPRR